jgi:RNA-splicing ligase RtcB
MITGNTLIEWGFKPGKWFADAITAANDLQEKGVPSDEIRLAVDGMQAKLPVEVSLRPEALPFAQFIEPEGADEIANVEAVIRHMEVLLTVPTIVAGAVMPDACPSGSAPGTIPVGGVVATKNAIHPDFHSADICCSMAISYFDAAQPVGDMLDIAMKSTHFGPGKRSASEVRQYKELGGLIEKFSKNPFLNGLEGIAEQHFLTQGDGNHFLYIGETEKEGKRAMVTHHGSRGLGAQLYKRGKAAALKHTSIYAPSIPAHLAWLDAETEQGALYWEALQIVREWTKMNHFAIHDLIAKRSRNQVVDRFWNEHNFVFQRDGMFYHGKGATPSFKGFSPDDQGHTLIPLNMSQPILIATHADNPQALGFAPHGAGRNLSRTAHINRLKEEFKVDGRGLSPNNIAEIMARETKGLDIRAYSGKPDVSELPSAYKNANQVAAQIEKHKLANVVDRVMPLGSIMAGEVEFRWSGRRKK